MKKFYLTIPVAVASAILLGFIEVTVAFGIFLIIPFATFWYLHKNEAHIFLEPTSFDERIVFFIMENREMVPFVAKKVDEQFARVRNKLIRVRENSVYVFKKKVVMFARQSKKYKTEDILRLRQMVKSSLFETLTGEASLKNFIMPAVGLGVYYLLFPLVGWIILLVGPFVTLYNVWSSGALEFAGGQSAGEITMFYISGARKMIPLTCELETQGWANYAGGIGKVKLTDGTDYFFHGNRIFFSGRGVHHTFSIELMEKANQFRSWGFRDWEELTEGMDMAERRGYDSIEDAIDDENFDLVKEVHERIRAEEAAPVAK